MKKILGASPLLLLLALSACPDWLWQDSITQTVIIDQNPRDGVDDRCGTASLSATSPSAGELQVTVRGTFGEYLVTATGTSGAVSGFASAGSTVTFSGLTAGRYVVTAKRTDIATCPSITGPNVEVK